MDFHHLQYFVAVAQTLNFREAARRLSVAQSSVSRAIAEMEKQLDVQLFFRDSRNIALTEAGKAYLPYALDILSASKAGRFAAKRVQEGNDKHLSIAAVSTSSSILTECLSAFSSQHRDVVVDIACNSGNEEIVALSESRFDFYFCHQSMLPQDNQMDYLITHRDTLVLVVPKGHRLANRPLDFSELKDERFITVSEVSGSLLYHQIEAICEANHYSPQIVNRYDKAESVLLSVSAGLGIAILPRALPSVFWPEKVNIVPIPNSNTERPYIVAWHKHLPNPSAHDFLKIVREKFLPTAMPSQPES